MVDKIRELLGDVEHLFDAKTDKIRLLNERIEELEDEVNELKGDIDKLEGHRHDHLLF